MRIFLTDDTPELLFPFTPIRRTWDIPIGGRTLRTSLARAFPAAPLIPISNNNPNCKAGDICINGRALPTDELMRALVERKTPPENYPLLDAPWDIVVHHTQILREEIAWRKKHCSLVEIRKGVWADAPITLPGNVVTNTQDGDIVIHTPFSCGAFSVLHGPLLIKKNCSISAHSFIAESAVGPVCKLGGEVKRSAFFGYSNKQHHGFIGDSVVAEWVNFGAGSTTSNMKNTYGPVRIHWKGEKKETPLQFLGSLIGAHVKISINCSLMTGTVMGACSHGYGIVHGTIPPFTQIFNSQKAELPLSIALTVAERMMQRRGKTLSEEEKNILSSLFSSTITVRRSFGVFPSSRISFS